MTLTTMNEFFSQYEQAFNALDVKGQADLFADTFVSLGPHGVIARSKEEFLSLAERFSGYYRSLGQEYAKILSLHETRISDEYALVKVHWGAKFKKMPNDLVEFDVSYLVQQLGGTKKIILFIAHEDEEKAMRDLGLIQAQKDI
jgi:hypothetical protein